MSKIIQNFQNISFWDWAMIKTRWDGKPDAYYIALHELGHAFGIGEIWKFLSDIFIFKEKLFFI